MITAKTTITAAPAMITNNDASTAPVIIPAGRGWIRFADVTGMGVGRKDSVSIVAAIGVLDG